MEMKKIKAVIFDMDGTLLDSMGVWDKVDRTFFERRGMTMPQDYHKNVKNMHFPVAAQYTKERFSLPDTEESIMEEWTELCYNEYEQDVRLKEGAYEYLKLLREKGIKLGYATANSRELCEVCLKNCGVLDYFTSRTYVSEVENGKSEPDIYLLAAERLGVTPDECVVFEDLPMGIKSAKKGGFTVCGVYEEASQKGEEDFKEYADYFISSFKELL